jgi:hypothetical protein
MAVIKPCDNCGRPTPQYRLAGVILDGRIAQICPTCASGAEDSSLLDRIAIPYAPRTDQGAIQPSTSRANW